MHLSTQALSFLITLACMTVTNTGWDTNNSRPINVELVDNGETVCWLRDGA